MMKRSNASSNDLNSFIIYSSSDQNDKRVIASYMKQHNCSKIDAIRKIISDDSKKS